MNALVKVFKKGKKGNFYNIGSNKNLNNLQITKSLINIAKRNMKIGKNVKIKFIKDRPGHDFRYALNSEKIKSKLGWRPKTSFNDGLKKTLLWYLNNKKYYLKIPKINILKRLGKK